MSTRRFRIGFSFAGGKRPFVENTARILAQYFGEDKILYDHDLEAEFADANLAFDLPAYYKNETDLIVTVFCKDYQGKEWCGLEWRAIYSLIKGNKSKQVMLCRFDFAEVKGLYGIEGFMELDKKTPEVFANRILERLAINEGRPKNYYISSGPNTVNISQTTIPHNLPAMQPFFGREKEMKKITDALDADSRTWGILIDAPGGMGKTSLAVFTAYSLPAGAFEKIVFVTLKSRELDDDGIRDLSGFLISGFSELFNELARELGHEKITQSLENERPKLLLDALRGSRILLILDNLESLTKEERDKVFTFVKRLPHGCKAILTSRGRIGSGAEELILEKLDEPAALQTLAELAIYNTALAKTSEKDRINLYKETAGKPLLLRWTAGQIGRGHCITINDAIRYLRSCPEGNDALEFIFGDLVEDLSEAEINSLCALTYFNLPAKVEHLAAIAERNAEEIDYALRSLTNRSLVVPNDEFTTFIMVPLVADFLRKKRPVILSATGDRLEKYIHAFVIENGYKEFDRFPVLDAAWPAVAAALPRFVSGNNAILQEICSALEDLFLYTGRWDEWSALETEGESSAVSTGDFYNAGYRVYNLGWIYYLRKQAVEVLTCADKAESYWSKAQAGDWERSMAFRLRGIGYQLLKDYPAAIVAYKECVKLRIRLNGESYDVSIAINDLADVERLSEDYDAAERDYNEALRIATAIDYKDGIANYMSNLALLALDKGEWLKAEDFAREAMPLCENNGRQELIAYNSRHFAGALVKLGKKQEASPYAKRAVDIFTQLGMEEDLAIANAIYAECE